MAKLPWTPWHQVVHLRDDLKSGELALHMFAADLYEVAMQRGKRPIYEQPENFFALTFPTHNLRDLVRDVALRIAGKSDKAVRQLEMTYGGGKTHTLIALHHLHNDPDNLPDLPAVSEFVTAIGEHPTRARIAALCFDKLDVEKGMEVRAPDGATRNLKQPWSVLAYQLAGDEGLKLLHAEGKAQERNSAPAENLLTALFEIPVKEGFGVLILMDEVLMYAREKVRHEPEWRGALASFCQYLTQAATKVDRCCVVASLLATDPARMDKVGKSIADELYDIFRREREEGVEPVVKEDVAEVLRRRFFKPESIREPDKFRQHVIAAIKGIAAIDDQTDRQGTATEERFWRSYPFHPDLTEVLYEKWTQLKDFQRTRGLLRTFALALRDAEKWDVSPLVGPNVFMSAPGSEGISEALREMVTVADAQGVDERRQAWTPILAGELGRARESQAESVGLRFREMEQAVVATFLHSQPTGQNAKTRDLMLLLGPTRPDKIELEKGLIRWAQTSYWLDDKFFAGAQDKLPAQWRMGNRPNLNQMHAKAAQEISDDLVMARLLDEIGKTRALTMGASAAGVRVHTQPQCPDEVKDDGQFRYAILGPKAASESGKPSAEARRYLDETTGPEKPRVFRNAILLLTPSRDGLELALARVRDYLAWEEVRRDLAEQEKEGHIDVARMQTLAMNLDKAKGRVPEAIKQAYCIVVTVSDKDEAQAFKIAVTDDPTFATIKADERARIQDTPITAEALMPGGPYDLWKEGETSRRVKDLAGAFAQLPHLPKMLKAQAIMETLVDGCVQGSFVLRLMRPDRSFRTWWRSRPDEAALEDPALELVLPAAAELAEIAPGSLAPGELPELWSGEQIMVDDVIRYFDSSRVVQVDRAGFPEPMQIPKAPREVVERDVSAAVETGTLWLISGPASLLGEEVPTGVLSGEAVLRKPPAPIPAPEILAENLSDAWRDNETTALAIARALSNRHGVNLPWKTVRDAISGAIQARFVELLDGATWPCDFAGAQAVKLKAASESGGQRGRGGEPDPAHGRRPNVLVADAQFEPSDIQELADAIPDLLKLRARSNVDMRFFVRIELGDGAQEPAPDAVAQINGILERLKDGFGVR